MPQDTKTEPQAMNKPTTSQVPYGIQRFTAECDPWLAPGVVVGIVKSSQGERQNNRARDDDRSTVATQGSGK
ncbi:hypothetical protein H0G86_009168 [Trichoderma simmonsii]|uniref:Uncharacterized protein n=1 Tax=Trichoderma simmonsii TaxID=1491479 RepID=A0A8G0LM83_9HYPO|nr:hypothetical protein H0G86_009168 [Trichoderma simmonsii]